MLEATTAVVVGGRGGREREADIASWSRGEIGWAVGSCAMETRQLRRRSSILVSEIAIILQRWETEGRGLVVPVALGVEGGRSVGLGVRMQLLEDGLHNNTTPQLDGAVVVERRRRHRERSHGDGRLRFSKESEPKQAGLSKTTANLGVV